MTSNETEVMRTIETAARTRYGTLEGFEMSATAPAIAPERFASGQTFVAEWQGIPTGFILVQPLDGMVYIANISVLPGASGRGIGEALLLSAEVYAKEQDLVAVTLATFKSPPWNGPWFKRCGYVPIPEEDIGPDHKAILDRHATVLDMSTRELLWKQTHP